MDILRRPIKPKTYISFLYIYETTWGTAGDICLVRETVAKESTSKFRGYKIKLPLTKEMERNRLAGLPIIKVAGYVGEGHPKDKNSEWEVYEGIDREIAMTVIKPWGFKLIET